MLKLFYASGKFNEGVYHIFQNAEIKLTEIPLLNNSLSNTKDWFQQVLDFVVAQSPKPGSLLLDPVVLSGEVKKDNPIINQVDHLKSLVDQLILKTVLLQVFFKKNFLKYILVSYLGNWSFSYLLRRPVGNFYSIYSCWNGTCVHLDGGEMAVIPRSPVQVNKLIT
jgi:hypothetical protein